MTWIERKKLALVPLFRPNAHPPDQIPADWSNEILRRVLFDPDPMTGADRSLRTYIQKASSGRADLDAVVMPRQDVDLQDVPPDHLEGQLGSQLRNQGFDAAAIVMLGGRGAGTSRGFWARFVMAEPLGTWAMEFMHILTGFKDIRPFPSDVDSPNGEGNISAFDEMGANGGMHPTVYTKVGISWLDASAIAQHTGRVASYDLHAVGLAQPPPSGRWTAIRIGTGIPYLMVEARMMVDQFESKSTLESGIGSQGVIVYRVQTSSHLGIRENNRLPVFLLTPTALTAGQTFTSDTGVTVQVGNALPGGFSVNIDDPAALVIVPNVIQIFAAQAANIIIAAGLVPEFTGPNHTDSWVFTQSPFPGHLVARGSTVTMLLRDDPLP